MREGRQADRPNQTEDSGGTSAIPSSLIFYSLARAPGGFNEAQTSVMSSSSSSDAGSSFWKNNSGRIPGRPTAASRMGPGGAVRGGSGPGGPSSSNSFQDYQESVSDAWDLGDDEFCIISGTVDTSARISKKVSQSAALNVIKTHRSGGDRGRLAAAAVQVSVHGGGAATMGGGGGTTVTVVESLDGLKIDRSIEREEENEKTVDHQQQQQNYEALNHVNEHR